MVRFVNPLTPRVKPWMIQSFLSFDSMDRTLKCDHSLESCGAVLYCGVVRLFPVCNLYQFSSLGTVRSERVNWMFFKNLLLWRAADSRPQCFRLQASVKRVTVSNSGMSDTSLVSQSGEVKKVKLRNTDSHPLKTAKSQRVLITLRVTG